MLDEKLPSLRERAVATLDHIEKNFALGNGDYREHSGKPAPSFAWGLGVLFSAFVTAAEHIDRATYQPRMDALFAALERGYWRTDGPVPGYNASRGSGGTPDRYYDDNAWFVLAYLDAFTLTRDARYRDAALRTLRFVLSGEDTKVGGGIYWHERNRDSKNTCINAPGGAGAIYAAKLRLAGATENEATARRLRDWLRATLRDPADNLYWDAIKVADGTVEKTKWSYNAALPIRLEADLGDRAEASRIAEASVRHWFDPAQHILKDDASFAHLLAENLLMLDARKYRTVVSESLDTLWARVRRPDGSYPKRWEVGSRDDHPEQLLATASAARAYAFAARSLDGKR